MKSDSAEIIIELGDAAATEALGRDLGRAIKPGHVLALIGELGSGKTTLVRGLAAGMGLDPEQVHSPTFTMIQFYPGAPGLYHVDFYRLERPAELEQIGLDEALEGYDSACAVEWADKFPAQLPAGRLEIELCYSGQGRRALLSPTDSAHVLLCAAVKA
ncbi:MAG: tRNA (adenosine(37)-N6)-threonylcarbamoyltransferase complex ATPase subunit type 1 TsaE [Candidatus Alcyoniella australis]|nr:tRNA (adenosine(37)-N6)-threonylcarbamoyltransferase complex ATPase subunit type 1 TsaE [Candidatus Alcyoniella australis]